MRERERKLGKKMVGKRKTGDERNLRELKRVIIVGKGEQVERQVGLKLDGDMEKRKIVCIMLKQETHVQVMSY